MWDNKRCFNVYEMPDYSIENQCTEKIIAGVDEVGYGSWAGPVLCAAVILPSGFEDSRIRDSKTISEKAREEIYESIVSRGVIFAIGSATPAEIDEINIMRATFLAMRRAVDGLFQKPDIVFVDGIRAPEFPVPHKTIVKGDSKSITIATASIIAKVTRDRMMASLAQEFPLYGWESNKGYGTSAHHKAIIAHGPCLHHRMSYKPLRAIAG